MMERCAIPTPAERRSDAIVHYLGLGLATCAVPILIALSVIRRGDWASVTAISVYGTCLVVMLGCSALYNITHGGPWTPIFKRMDHSAIYLKIAASFTPLIALTGVAGVPLLAGLWGTAIGGTSLKIIAPNNLRWLGLTLYLGMGWIGVWAGAPIIAELSPAAWWLLLLGGVLYTGGVGFFLWERLPFHTTIWHAFVLIATALIYSAILVEVLAEV